MRTRGFLTVGIALLALASVGVVAANEAPLAEAGLDQEAAAYTTVYLDAGGSQDVDGQIDQYEWSIEAPNGTTLTPDCENCRTTRFVPRQTGQYNVTVEVVDLDGAASEDTLYVNAAWGSPASGSGGGPGTPALNPEDGNSPNGFGMIAGSSGGSGDNIGFVVERDGELFLRGSPEQDQIVIDGPDNTQVAISGDRYAEVRGSQGEARLSEFRRQITAAGVGYEALAESINPEFGPSNHQCSTSFDGCTTTIDSDELNQGILNAETDPDEFGEISSNNGGMEANNRPSHYSPGGSMSSFSSGGSSSDSLASSPLSGTGLYQSSSSSSSSGISYSSSPGSSSSSGGYQGSSASSSSGGSSGGSLASSPLSGTGLYQG